jgi:hypothetical protein
MVIIGLMMTILTILTALTKTAGHKRVNQLADLLGGR